jgi:DNA-binding transcriptional LysR family regulator
MPGHSTLENFRLTVFRAVAAQRSFRRAAEALYLTQPAVTQQIKALEAEVGAPMFDRTGKAVALTQAGEVLLRRATESHEILLRAQVEMAALEGRVSGPLRLAVSMTIVQYILPPMLGRFLRRYPGVSLRMQSANTGDVAAAVLDGTVDLGMVEGPVHRPELRLEPWRRDELVLVVPAGHPWIGRAVSLEELAAAPLLMRERGSGTREVVDAAIEQAFAAAGLASPKIVPAMELNSTEALLAYIEQGLGAGFHSRAAVRGRVRMGTLVPVAVRGLKIARDLSFVTVRSGEPRGNAAILLDFLREQAARSKR